MFLLSVSSLAICFYCPKKQDKDAVYEKLYQLFNLRNGEDKKCF